MKAITITISEALDRRATMEAQRRGISKSELIREGLAAVLPEAKQQIDDDPWRQLAGFGDRGISIKPEDIDTIVYQHRR